MSKFRLTPEQHRFMDTFGYLHFPGFLNDCIDQIIEAFEQVWVDLNIDHPETQRTYIVPFIGQSEYLSSLLDDDRIDGIFASLLGDDYTYLGSDGNFYSGGHRLAFRRRLAPVPSVSTRWHFTLTRLTADTGAVRFIPGSHRYGELYAETVQQNISSLEETYALDGPSVPAVAPRIESGGFGHFQPSLEAQFMGWWYAAAYVHD